MSSGPMTWVLEPEISATVLLPTSGICPRAWDTAISHHSPHPGPPGFAGRWVQAYGMDEQRSGLRSRPESESRLHLSAAGTVPRLSEPQFPHPHMGMIMAAREVAVRMRMSLHRARPRPLSCPLPFPRPPPRPLGSLAPPPDSQVAQPASSTPLSQSFSPSQRHEAGTHLWLVGPQLNFSAGHTCLAVERHTCVASPRRDTGHGANLFYWLH